MRENMMSTPSDEGGPVFDHRCFLGGDPVGRPGWEKADSGLGSIFMVTDRSAGVKKSFSLVIGGQPMTND
jgi:hypothetical protein